MADKTSRIEVFKKGENQFLSDLKKMTELPTRESLFFTAKDKAVNNELISSESRADFIEGYLTAGWEMFPAIT